MAIKRGDFVKLSYTGRVKNGTAFDTTDERVAKELGIYNEKAKYEPQLIVVGSGYAVKGLEEDLGGKGVGYKGSVEVAPEKGFGERDPALIETFSITKFKERPQRGMQVSIGGRTGVVETVIGRRVRVDFNHPLAGEDLVYDYTIEGKVEDPKAKIEELIELYTQTKLDAKIKDNMAIITVPYPVSFDQRWMISKRLVAEEILKNTDIKEVQYVERHRPPEAEAPKKEVKKPAKKSAKKSTTSKQKTRKKKS